MLIEEGHSVKEGDVLARLDATEAQAQLSLNQSQLTLARSQVAEIEAMLAQAIENTNPTKMKGQAGLNA